MKMPMTTCCLSYIGVGFVKSALYFLLHLIVLNIFSIPFLVVLNLKFPGGYANAHIHVKMLPFV